MSEVEVEVGCKECKKVYSLENLPETIIIENKKKPRSNIAISKVVLEKSK